MTISPLFLGIGGTALILLFSLIFRPIADFLVFMYLLFIFANIEGNTALATFYSVGLLGALIFGLLTLSRDQVTGKTVTNIPEAPNLSSRFSSFKTPFLGLILGIGTLAFMFILQGTREQAIIGTPHLAIESAAFIPLTRALIGYAENRIFFTAWDLFETGGLKPIFAFLPFGSLMVIFGPFILVPMAFGIFHLTAYSLAFSSIIFAALVMVVFLVVRLIFRDELPANIAHMGWNLSV